METKMNLPLIIKTWLEKFKEPRPDGATHRFGVDLNMSVFKASLDYGMIREIQERVAEKVVEKIYPEIKDKLLSKKETTKLLNEIRLLISKELIKGK